MDSSSKTPASGKTLTRLQTLPSAKNVGKIMRRVNAFSFLERAVTQHICTTIFARHIRVIQPFCIDMQEAGYKYLCDVESLLPAHYVCVNLVEPVSTNVDPCDCC